MRWLERFIRRTPAVRPAPKLHDGLIRVLNQVDEAKVVYDSDEIFRSPGFQYLLAEGYITESADYEPKWRLSRKGEAARQT